MTYRPTEDEIVEIGARGLHDNGMDRAPWDARDERARQAYREGMQRVLTALRSAGLVVEQGWQDISTAPRDGTWFFAITEYEHDGEDDGKEPCAARWVGGDFPWQIGGTGENALREWALIHWRPLPAPPATGGES